MTVVEEGHIWVNVSTAAAASRDNLVLDNRDIIIIVMESAVWLDYESKRQLGLLENGIGVGDSVEGRADVL